MGKLSVQTPSNGFLDICDSEWFIYREDGTWYEIDPVNDLQVRHGSNEYWVPIVCETGTDYCPPEAMVDCWSGYTGNFDSGKVINGGPTGHYLVNCDGAAPKTYTGHTPDYNVAGGRYFATSPIIDKTFAHSLPATFMGSEAEVTEMLVHAGSASGAIDISVDSLDGDVRVRIYHGCDLLGDTALNGYTFNAFYNAQPPKAQESDCGVAPPANNFITVRVDAEKGQRWRVRVGSVNVVQMTNYERPAPCFGTFGPQLPCRVNDEHRVLPESTAYEMIHKIQGSGLMHLDLKVTGSKPVTISVFYNSQILAQTVTPNSNTNTATLTTLPFQFNVVGGDDFVTVRYEAPRGYNKWEYTIFCPGQRGSRIYTLPCLQVPDDEMCLPLNVSLPPAYTIQGQGAFYTDFYFDMAGKTEGDIVVEFVAPDDVQILFYQGVWPNDKLVGGTKGFVKGHNRFYFEYYPANGTMLRVRVLGPCCPDWALTVSCPIPFAEIIIGDASVIRGRKGEVKQLCFPVSLTHRTPREISFNYKTTPIDAIETPSNCVIPGQITPSPFCDIVAEGGAVTAGFANNTNIGYPQAQQICSTLHSPNCASGGQYYVLETEINLPYTGTYTVVGAADDNIDIYIDCIRVLNGPQYNDAWRDVHRATFTAKAGWQTISAVYQNVPNCTPGWAKFVVLDNAGAVIFATNATTHAWRSKVGGINIEPEPEPLDIAGDYNKVQGSSVIHKCENFAANVCVDVCGTDLMGPDVYLNLTLSAVKGARVRRGKAVGTIINENNFQCDQNALDTVKDGGLCEYVNRNGRRMYVQKAQVSNGAATYVMEREINFPQSGIYTFLFFGKDVAELYMDCNLIAQATGGTAPAKARRVRQAVNKGSRHFYIHYMTYASKVKRDAYASMVILDPQNQIFYASNAADWRGRVIDSGTPPSCDQFPNVCDIVGNTIEQQSHSGASGGFTVGHGAIKVRSSLHSNAEQPSNSVYTLQYRPTLPAGTYTLKWSCDDSGTFYVNCKAVATKTSSWRTTQTNTFTITDGSKPTVITLTYANGGGNVTWANWAILNSSGVPVSVSGPGLPGASSARGNPLYASTGEPLGQTYHGGWPGRIVVHLGNAISGPGTNYAWWSAEREINIPADGSYYVMGAADDDMQLFIGCQNRPITGARFELESGVQKMQVRVYNRKSKNENFFFFTLYKADGTVVYDARAEGWRAKRTDLDFSGLA